MVKYMKGKSGKIIGVVWDDEKMGTASIVIGGAVLLAIGVTALAWWKTQPQMKLRTQPRLSTCHTCGG